MEYTHRAECVCVCVSVILYNLRASPIPPATTTNHHTHHHTAGFAQRVMLLLRPLCIMAWRYAGTCIAHSWIHIKAFYTESEREREVSLLVVHREDQIRKIIRKKKVVKAIITF